MLLKHLIALLFILPSAIFGQIPPYYSSIDFSLMGEDLRDDLSNLITITHTSPSTYSEVWDILKVADLDPTNSTNVLLMYGYNDGDVETDRSRDKNNNGGSVGQWNREHVFPRSLGSPNLGTVGPGADPHNLRASDVQNNGNRGNRQFADGGGNAGPLASSWYPGDEWKGDAARIVMYMYLRYGDRCLPNAVAIGSTNAIDPNMIDVLLDWNAEDPVSEIEINRNNTIQGAIGNRNPFIDNPHIANHIWGGKVADDTWGSLSIETNVNPLSIQVYPNPSLNKMIFVSVDQEVQFDEIYIVNLQGKEVFRRDHHAINSTIVPLDLNTLPNGIFLLHLTNENGVLTRKIVLQ